MNTEENEENLDKDTEKKEDPDEVPLEVTLATTSSTQQNSSTVDETDIFLKEYQKMIEDSLEQRKREQPQSSRVILTPTIPWHLLKSNCAEIFLHFF
jgi:hypothetical protein